MSNRKLDAAVLATFAVALMASMTNAPAAATAIPTTRPSTAPAWVEPMRQVHAKFTGRPGTFAHFGDSITFSGAFWSGLPDDHKNLSPEAEAHLKRVSDHMLRECWRGWKGPAHGNQGGAQIDWAQKNVDAWLRDLNPETALIMFGTNDLGGGRAVEDYARRTREVAEKCLSNGTVVILSTPPPRSGRAEASHAYAAAIRAIGRALNVPVVDYFAAITARRPNDWDGSAAQFGGGGGRDPYDVPTLISRDGVHPSAPKQYAGDYSEAAMSRHGYNLRTHLTMTTYAQVIGDVLVPTR